MGNDSNEYKLKPIGYDYGGRPEYDVGPIYHGQPLHEYHKGISAQDLFAIKPGTDWYSCPNCDEPLNFNPTHDQETDYGLSAVPDQWTCDNCEYTWAE